MLQLRETFFKQNNIQTDLKVQEFFAEMIDSHPKAICNRNRNVSIQTFERFQICLFNIFNATDIAGKVHERRKNTIA